MISIDQVSKLHQLCLHSKLLPHHYVPTAHNKVEFFGVAYLVKQAGGHLELMKETMFPNATDNDEIEDVMSLQDNEAFVNEVIEVPATSEDLQTFDDAAREEKEKKEVRNQLCNC